jgi:hypothetical protein
VATGQLEEATELGLGLLVGTVSPEGRPRVTRGWSLASVDSHEGRLRLVMTADDRVAVANLAGARIAVTGGDVRTLRSAQVKGRVVAVEDVTADDLARMAMHVEEMFTAVTETDGTPRAVLDNLLPLDVVAVEIDVDGIYDQTPGPSAGARREMGA